MKWPTALTIDIDREFVLNLIQADLYIESTLGYEFYHGPTALDLIVYETGGGPLGDGEHFFADGEYRLTIP